MVAGYGVLGRKEGVCVGGGYRVHFPLPSLDLVPSHILHNEKKLLATFNHAVHRAREGLI